VLRGTKIKIGAIAITAIGGVIAGIKFLADWAGIMTLPEQLTAAQYRALEMLNWLAALIFDCFPAGLMAVGLSMAFAPEIVAATTRKTKIERAIEKMGFDTGAIEYGIWDQIQKVELFQAAYLWADQTPPTVVGRMTANIMAHYQMLEQAIEDQVIPLVERKIDGRSYSITNPTPNTKIPRSSLVRFAEKIGHKPKFLFPEERGTAQSKRI
jgi:hypothetical protein